MRNQWPSPLAFFAVTAWAVGVCVSVSIAQTVDRAPPMGGGYTDVIAIPVNDLVVRSIAGALIKPTGPGPFAAVIYLSGCTGISGPLDMMLQKKVVDHFIPKGMAVLIVDPFTPRGEAEGVCAKINEANFVELARRGGNDAWGAVEALKAMPGIDPNKIFLQGYSFGAISSLFAVDTKSPVKHETKIAGVVAYYPLCYEGVDPSVPTLVLIGEKDDWTPASACQSVSGKSNIEVVVYPGVTHGFETPGVNRYFLGHHLVYDEKAARDAEQRADAFMAAHMK